MKKEPGTLTVSFDLSGVYRDAVTVASTYLEMTPDEFLREMIQHGLVAIKRTMLDGAWKMGRTGKKETLVAALQALLANWPKKGGSGK